MSLSPLSTTFIYRARCYWHHDWQTWYEPCPVIAHTPMRIKVVSQTFPNSPLYPGGEFNLNRIDLTNHGKCYHSRHGEYFYLEKPEQGSLFPSADILGMSSALDQEAESLGWDLKRLDDKQFAAYILALQSGLLLSTALMEV